MRGLEFKKMKFGPGKETVPLYLIPIMIGLCGVLFSRQIPDLLWRSVVVMVSVSAPQFVIGTAIARLPRQRSKRLLLIVGAVILFVGGIVTILDYLDTIGVEKMPPVFFGKILRISYWLGAAGLLLGLLVLLYSVLRREAQIEELSRHFHTLTEHMNEGVLLVDQEQQICQVNGRFLEMFGLNANDVLGTSITQLFERYTLDIDNAKEDIQWRDQENEFQLSMQVGPRKRYFWISMRPVFDTRGILNGNLVAVRDITELRELSEQLEQYAQNLESEVRKRTAELRRSERRFRNLLMNMQEGFLTIDAKHDILFANDRLGALLGISAAQLVGHNLSEIMTDASSALLLPLLQENAGYDRVADSLELLLQYKNSDEIPVMCAIAPIEEDDEGGSAARFSLVMTDIRELKAMQRQLENHAEELEAANEELHMIGKAKDTFLTNVSHELRTPLSTIQGYMEMLQSGELGEISSEQGKALSIMMRNGERLAELINEIIEFSRMHIHGLTLSMSLFPFARIVANCVKSFSPLVSDKQITIHVDIPDTLPPVWGDQKRILQVLTILLSNAVKFSEKGSEITIRGTVRSANTLAFSVCDQGIGIDPIYHERIFDRFFQVDSSKTRQYAGAGIGLSLARSLVEAHGGTIELQSALNEGSTFTVVLPGAVFDADLSAENKIPLRVLAIGKDRETISILQQTMRKHGIAINVEQDGYALTRKMEKGGYDVALVLLNGENDQHELGLAGIQMGNGTTEYPMVVVLQQDFPLSRLAGIQKDRIHALRCPFSPKSFLQVIQNAHAGGEPLLGLETTRTSGIAGNHRIMHRVLLVDNDMDFVEWFELAVKSLHVECLHADSLSQALRMAVSREIHALLVNVDIFPKSDIDEMIDLVNSYYSGRKPCIIAITVLPVEHIQLENKASVFRKPFDPVNVLSTIVNCTELASL